MGFRLPDGADLSIEQLDIINLPTTKDWVIQGAPGTGKTVMAIYRAGQASQTSGNKPVLMLVYNNPLMRFLSTGIRGNYYKKVQVSTYHQWLSDIFREHSLGTVPKVSKEEGEFDWVKISNKLSKIGVKYSHTIIDEAQDFPIELLKIIKMVSKNITCFIDPNQAIEMGKTDTYKTIDSICVESPYKLTKNFRNTKPIRDLSALFCLEGKPAPATIPGKKPMAIKCIQGDFADKDKKMIDVILRNKEKNIGIIVNPESLTITYETMSSKLRPYGVNVQMHKTKTEHKIDFDLPGVKIVSYGTMKGLEFDMVLLPLFDKIKMMDGGIVDFNRVYVALSRPISELYMFYWSEKPTPGKIPTMSKLAANRKMLDWK